MAYLKPASISAICLASAAWSVVHAAESPPPPELYLHVQQALLFLQTPTANRELSLTSDQSSVVAKLRTTQKSAEESLSGEQDPEARKEKEQALDDIYSRNTARLLRTLQPQQVRRLNEIACQSAGAQLFAEEQEFLQFELSVDQRREIASILGEYSERWIKLLKDLELNVPGPLDEYRRAQRERFEVQKSKWDDEAPIRS